MAWTQGIIFFATVWVNKKNIVALQQNWEEKKWDTMIFYESN